MGLSKVTQPPGQGGYEANYREERPGIRKKLESFRSDQCNLFDHCVRPANLGNRHHRHENQSDEHDAALDEIREGYSHESAKQSISDDHTGGKEKTKAVIKSEGCLKQLATGNNSSRRVEREEDYYNDR